MNAVLWIVQGLLAFAFIALGAMNSSPTKSTKPYRRRKAQPALRED